MIGEIFKDTTGLGTPWQRMRRAASRHRKIKASKIPEPRSERYAWVVEFILNDVTIHDELCMDQHSARETVRFFKAHLKAHSR